MTAGRAAQRRKVRKAATALPETLANKETSQQTDLGQDAWR